MPEKMVHMKSVIQGTSTMKLILSHTPSYLKYDIVSYHLSCLPLINFT